MMGNKDTLIRHQEGITHHSDIEDENTIITEKPKTPSVQKAIIRDTTDPFVKQNIALSQQPIDISLADQPINIPSTNLKPTYQNKFGKTHSPVEAISSKIGDDFQDIEEENEHIISKNQEKPQETNINNFPITRLGPEIQATPVLKKNSPSKQLINESNIPDYIRTPHQDIECKSIISKLREKYIKPSRNIAKTLTSKTFISSKVPIQYALIEYKMIDKKILSIMYESPIFKYHPGFSMKYADRYCIATQTNFCYYVNLWSAHSSSKPMMCVPIEKMMSVEVIKSAYDENSNENYYEFEIFLKNEQDPMTLDDKIAYPLSLHTEEIIKMEVNNNTKSFVLFTTPQKIKNVVNCGGQSVTIRKPLTSSKKSKTKRILKGHLMLSPENYFENLQYEEDPIPTEQHCYCEDGIKFDSVQNRENYQQFVKNCRSQVLMRTRSTEVGVTKNPKGWMANFKGNKFI